ELLTGRRPFRSEKRDELLDQIERAEPRPPRQFDDAIPKELERICLKALAKRAADRYTTAKDLVEDLRHFLAAHVPVPPTTPAVPPPGPAVPPPATPDTPATAAAPPVTPPSDGPILRIVRKGLRSFDAQDADFFLELLPGPRDRDGLPDSLRFWKTRI